jgi:putative transposase
MIRLQAFKYEIQPNGEQQRQMRRFAGSCRFVFNKALAMQKDRYEQGEKKLGYTDLCKELTAWKVLSETLWLKESHSQVLQQSLKNLERAYKNFFDKRAAFPQFKKKGQGDSFHFPQGFKLDQGNSRVFLPKLGWIRYHNSREILGEAKNITVSANGGKWFVSIQTEREIERSVHPSTSIVGIDVGITRFATLSDSSYIKPLNTFRKHEIRLAKYQRRMSHIKKHSSKQFSSNWKKAKARVQKIHSRIANVRKDFLHKTTTTISKNHAIVCIEDLQVRNMSKSAAGSSDSPRRNVKAKSGLNKSILDQGWFEFRRQLEYKQVWLGGDVLAVPPHNTSRTCPACGHVSAENRQTQAKFACVECGYENNADLIGAINILNRGMKMLEGQDTADASAGCASTARIACEVNGAVMPSAAGTRRSDSGVAQCRA